MAFYSKVKQSRMEQSDMPEMQSHKEKENTAMLKGQLQRNALVVPAL
jgi:hypothetical protein